MSDLHAWIDRMFQDPEMLRMGHAQRAEDANLGLGWIYYALGRAMRPALAVVIGSWRGFVPLTIARSMTDNTEGGKVVFIDPSLVDDHWKDPAQVARHFASFGAPNVEHHCMTTQQFALSEAYRQLGQVDLLFVDGYHTSEQARFDHETFEPLLSPSALVLFHDTAVRHVSRLYGQDKAYEKNVAEYTDSLKARPDLDVFDLPIGAGLTLVRRRQSD
jgi:predicted O-methyltransferase YrrM